MSKEKGIEKDLPLLLKLKSIDLMLYTAVRVIRHAMPGVTIESAIENFKDAFELTDKDLKTETGLQIHNRTNIYIKETGLWK